VLDFASYVPTEGAVEKLNLWARHGAKIEYLSSHRTREDVAIDEQVLASHGFPIGPVYLALVLEIHSGDEPMTLISAGGRVHMVRGRVDRPDIVLAGPPTAWWA
jgi:hypothetical protein